MLWISSKRVAVVLTAAISLLSVSGVTTQWIQHTYGSDSQLRYIWLFDLNREQNLPAWYSSTTLALAATLLSLIAARKKDQEATYANHWLVLSIIFFYLSIDEAISIHERGNRIFAPFQPTGFFLYSWVILGIGFVAVVGLSYLRFLTALPPAHRWRFVSAGAIYVTGALAVEMLEARWASIHSPDNLTYATLVWIEETLEMAGIGLFIYALLVYIEKEMSRSTLIDLPSHSHKQTSGRNPNHISSPSTYKATGTDG